MTLELLFPGGASHCAVGAVASPQFLLWCCARVGDSWVPCHQGLILLPGDVSAELQSSRDLLVKAVMPAELHLQLLLWLGAHPLASLLC